MVLVINGERIEDAVIDGEAMRLRRAPPAQSEVPDHVDTDEKLREYAKENVIARTLLRQEARAREYDIRDDEIDAGIEQMMAEQGGREAFRARHKVTEADERMMRSHVESALRVQRLMDEICRGVPGPTDDEARAFHDEHVDEYTAPREVRASHIIMRPSGPADAREVYGELVEVRRELVAGADFAELWEKHSTCRTEPGGDLGFFARGRMTESFDAVVFSMAVGEVSPVFLTEFGYHVAKVTDTKDAAPRPFDETKSEIADRLLRDRKNDEIGRYVDGLQKKAKIVEEAENEEAAGRKTTKQEKRKRKRKKRARD